MIFKYFHLGLRQVVMALMDWAIDVPQELLQSDAKTGPRAFKKLTPFLFDQGYLSIIFIMEM
jgi:hypothetical protein